MVPGRNRAAKRLSIRKNDLAKAVFERFEKRDFWFSLGTLVASEAVSKAGIGCSRSELFPSRARFTSFITVWHGVSITHNRARAISPREYRQENHHHLPIDADTNQYETGEVQSEYSEKWHDPTKGFAENPLHCPRPSYFHRHHQKGHLKFEQNARYRHCSRLK